MSINQRVAYWFKKQKESGLSQAKFADLWGISRQTVGQYARENGSIGITPICKILDYDKQLNARWLILGEGSMYNNEVDESEKTVKEYEITLNNTYITEQKLLLQKLESSKDAQIADLKNQVTFLKNLIEERL